MLSRTKPAIGPGAGQNATDQKKKKKLPKVEDLLDSRDYTGAITLLEVSHATCFCCYKICCLLTLSLLLMLIKEKSYYNIFLMFHSFKQIKHYFESET